MTTTYLDHEDKLLGRLGASEQTIDSLLDEIRYHAHDAFSLCRECEGKRAEIIRLRKMQRMARGDLVGAQRLMR